MTTETKGTDFAGASKLTASWCGNSEPATHAVPMDSNPNNATSICGQVELVVHETERSAPSPFDPDSVHACKRCAKKARAAIAKATP